MDIVHWTILQDKTNPRLGVSRHQSDTMEWIRFVKCVNIFIFLNLTGTFNFMDAAFNNQRVEYNQSKIGSIQTPIGHNWKDFICQMDQPCHLSWYHRSILLDNLNVCMKEDILVCISIWLVRLVCLQSAFWILYRRWNSYKKVPKFLTVLFGYS